MKRILLIEDELILSSALLHKFSKSNKYHVDICYSNPLLKKLLAGKFNYDFVVLDSVLPFANSIELLKSPKLKTTKIIFVSKNPSLKQKDQVLSHGVSHYLELFPYSLSSYLDLVYKTIDHID
jgi:DNA-binding response OmpR family regulator